MENPDAERTVEELGADGTLPTIGRDFAALTVQNFSANKLDYLLDTSVRITGERVANRVGRIRAEVTIANTATPGRTSPQYVYGPNVAGQVAGQYIGLVTLYLPKGAGLVGQSGDLSEGRAGAVLENDRTAVGFPVRLAAGETRRVVLDLTLPPAGAVGYRFDLIPASARSPDCVQRRTAARGWPRTIALPWRSDPAAPAQERRLANAVRALSSTARSPLPVPTCRSGL